MLNLYPTAERFMENNDLFWYILKNEKHNFHPESPENARAFANTRSTYGVYATIYSTPFISISHIKITFEPFLSGSRLHFGNAERRG